MISGVWRLAARARSAFGRADLDREFDEEVAAHLELAVEENVRRGMSAEEARRDARIRFGGVLTSKEHYRDARGLPLVEVGIQDLRYAVRTLRRSPGFAVAATLILALGIGANAAVFDVVNRILLRPLPFAHPEQLAWIEPAQGKSGLSSLTYSVDAFEEFRARTHSFQDVTAYYAFSSPDNRRLGGRGEAIPISAMSVAGNFFQLLGVRPALGRAFAANETQQGGPRAVMLSYPFWQRQFGGNPHIVGQTLSIDNTPTTVVGVLPERFDFGAVFTPASHFDVFMPVIPDDMRDWGNTLALIGRLEPNVPIARADADARAIAPELHFNARRYPSGFGYTGRAMPLKEHVSGQLRRPLIVLWCAVGFTLLIACVNLANLLIARNGARTKELALRAALGASRGRIVRQLLTDSMLLTGAGAVLGLGVAAVAVRFLAHQAALSLPLVRTVRVDRATFAWTFGIAAIACLAFGLAPALRVSVRDVQTVLKEIGSGTSAGRSHQRLRASLVVSEVALACILLVGAGLLLRSFVRVLDVNLGFRPDNVAAIQMDYEDNGPGQRAQVFEETVKRIDALPGVTMAGVTDNLPLEGNRSWGLQAKGVQYRPGELPGAIVYMITPGYLEAMGVSLREGRLFTWSDGGNTQPVVVINEAAAHRLWPNEDPVGQMAVINGQDTRVIGVVSDVRETSLETTGAWQMYLPVSQARPTGAFLTIRSALPLSVLAPSVMGTLRARNPAQSATRLRPIEASVDRAVSPRRFFLLLVAAFAAFGLILAALGVYSVISYSVAQRTQEIGIRMAIGASASQVTRAMLWQTMRLVVLGIALGAFVSGMLSHLIASMLFETAPTDAAAFAGTVLVLLVAALCAALIPSYRAARIDPKRALHPA